MTGGVRGLNVTLPHKQAAAELVNELTPRAARAQAVNTIAFFEDTTLLGDNTDGVGLICDLERNLKIELADKRVLMLGAGGAARGVMGPLMERELRSLTIANRTPLQGAQARGEFSDMGKITGCTFSELRGPAVRSHHQRDVREPAGRNAGSCRPDSSTERPCATTWPTAGATRRSRAGRAGGPRTPTGHARAASLPFLPT